MGTVDEKRLFAATDLVTRTGSVGFEIGYLNDDVPAEDADWWAAALYKGARITTEHHKGPVEAAEALAVKLLTGARCKCGKLVNIAGIGAFAFRNPVMADGKPFPVAEAAAAGQCKWEIAGTRWESACGR